MTLRNKNEHFACRQIFTASAKRHGFAPFYWDNGYPDNHQFGLFNRSTGAQYYPTTISLIVTAH